MAKLYRSARGIEIPGKVSDVSGLCLRAVRTAWIGTGRRCAGMASVSLSMKACVIACLCCSCLSDEAHVLKHVEALRQEEEGLDFRGKFVVRDSYTRIRQDFRRGDFGPSDSSRIFQYRESKRNTGSWEPG